MNATYEPFEPFDEEEAPTVGNPPEGFSSWEDFYEQMDFNTWAEFYDWYYDYFDVTDTPNDSGDGSASAG